jgi:hypothetical protein
MLQLRSPTLRPQEEWEARRTGEEIRFHQLRFAVLPLPSSTTAGHGTIVHRIHPALTDPLRSPC